MNIKRVAIPVVILAVAVLGYFGWHYMNQGTRGELTLYGNVDIRSVNLSFRVNGRLHELSVDEGDTVKQGQIIGNIDDRPYQNALQQAQANVMAAQAQLSLSEAGFREEQIAQARAAVAQAQASYDFANSNYQRLQGLWRSRSISANELDNARSNKEQSEANLKAASDQLNLYVNGNRPQEIEAAKAALLQAQAALSQSELNLADTQLASPSDGTILTRAVEPGTMLNAGSTVLTLSLTRPVWIRAYIDGVNLSYAIPGSQVEITTDGQPDKTYHGVIGFVSPTAEFTPKSVETPVLRTDLVYRLRIVVKDADDALRQGMPVTIKFVRS
jgi:HlyD family secretion protein